MILSQEEVARLIDSALTLFSPVLLAALREYWRGLKHKPTEWLFPGTRVHAANYQCSGTLAASTSQRTATHKTRKTTPQPTSRVSL